MNETTETGEWLTRGTVWLALALYTGAEVLMSGRCRGGSGRPGRLMNTAGCAVFITHVASAFAFYHHWSHSAAYEGTARQTAQLTGWNWGGGLYVNYLFGLAWMADVVWSWAAPAGYLNRSMRVTGMVRSFFLFMIFNGTVVFVHGAARWFGIALCLILVLCWARASLLGSRR